MLMLRRDRTLLPPIASPLTAPMPPAPTGPAHSRGQSPLLPKCPPTYLHPQKLRRHPPRTNRRPGQPLAPTSSPATSPSTPRNSSPWSASPWRNSPARSAALENGLFTACLNETISSRRHAPDLPQRGAHRRSRSHPPPTIAISCLAEGFTQRTRNPNAWTFFLRYQGPIRASLPPRRGRISSASKSSVPSFPTNP